MDTGLKYCSERKRPGINACILVLLVLYSAVSLRIDSLHRFFHTEEVANLHSPEQEINPCHKNIYHQQRDAGCAHQSHVTSTAKCQFCEFNISPDGLLIKTVAVLSVFQIQEHQFFSPEKTLTPLPFLLSGRSPPVHTFRLT